ILNTFTAKMKGGSSTKVTITVLQNIPVLGVGKDLGEVKPLDYSKKKKKGAFASVADKKKLSVLTISVAVSPEQGQDLALAMAQGDIYITIRGRNDDEIRLLKGVDTRMFFK
ncbi:RcpC/CpaB family pilus assembly protein, partial [bacterium]